MFRFLAVFIVFVLGTAHAYDASARQIVGKFSGSSWATGVDSNDDGVTAVDAFSSGKAALLGSFTIKGLAETLPWDSATLCSPTELKLTSLIHPGAVTTAKGDQVYVVIADGPESYVCFNFVDGTSLRGETFLHVAGGTGRFSEASGQLVLSFTGTSIANSAGVSLGSGFEGRIEGEIIVAE